MSERSRSADRQAGNLPEPVDRVGQPALGPGRQIDLRDIAGHDDPRVLAHPRQEHLHLRHGRVLAFVENDHGVIERTPAHVGQRGDLDQIIIHVPPDLVIIHQIMERIQQGTQVGIDLGLEIAGQEAQVFASLDRRAHQHDFLDAPSRKSETAMATAR